MSGAYFLARGNNTYSPSQYSGGAWRDDELHLAPVAGLVIHHMERWRKEVAGNVLMFSRFSMDILGQIARDDISLETTILRPGRTIELVETVAEINGRATIRARGWLLKTSDLAEIAGDTFDAMPPMEECLDSKIVLPWSGGFMDSIVCVEDSGKIPGKNRAWVTSDIPLVHGEDPEPLAEFSKFLDVANGVAAREDPTQWMFPNVDLTFHLFRQPVGTKVGFNTRVAFGPTGIGITTSVIHDANGPVGTLNQSLTVRPIAELNK
ncbi:hypothetical protein N24_0846 [Corynebacterium suranareeae]|uniref:Thioesterase n=1 Tax=Corynebacterium suranareeae TaxID=2506452 RepID=A0A169RRW3_9CORY|nr:acyl-CoA thioesterase domain-containing protein [Corynebacterium suranareeae]BAU95108.1 hypothetical protein N24_0846 [Corynebacterium suranareeae]